MIEIILTWENIGKHFSDGKYFYEHANVSNKKPFSRSLQNGDFKFSLVDEIHNWFIENNISYSLRENYKSNTIIIFEKESDAVYFKLIWC